MWLFHVFVNGPIPPVDLHPIRLFFETATDLGPFVMPVVKRPLPIKKDSNSIETSKRLRHYHQQNGGEGSDKFKCGDSRIKGFRKSL